MNEAQLELAIMELFQDEGYEYVRGNTIMRETTDVLLRDDLRLYLKRLYSSWLEARTIRFMMQTRHFLPILLKGLFFAERIKRKKIYLFGLLISMILTTTFSKS